MYISFFFLISHPVFVAEVPNNVRLTLDIELIDIHKEDLFKTIDANKDKYISIEEVESWLRSTHDVSNILLHQTYSKNALRITR